MANDHDGGSFHGTALRSRDLGSFLLTERQYRAGLATPLHAHERALLCLVLDGAYQERHNNRVFHCARSTTLFHAAQEAHGELIGARGAHSLVIELDGAWMDRTFQTSGTSFQSVVAYDGAIRRSPQRRLIAEFFRDDPESALAIGGLLSEILGELFRLERRETGRPDWLARAANLIDETFAERLTLERIAGEVDVHPVHLAQSFRRFHGCTVGDYLRRRRVAYACEQLARSDTPLIEIAIAAGFADQSHFTRTFRRALGVTPSEYRGALR